MNVHEKLDYIMENIVCFKYFAEFNLILIQNYNNLGQGSGNIS